jgi:hypothetical protein
MPGRKDVNSFSEIAHVLADLGVSLLDLIEIITAVC